MGRFLEDVLAPPVGFMAARVEMNEDCVLALAAASGVALVRPSNQPSHRGHTAGGWSPTVADNQLWGELVTAAGEISCPSAGRNLSAAGEVLMSADI